ncbi:DUF3047 domain-containing protein [Halomonas elongata]|uniref:DUF3047 domain-containing protein n=1 Tax=Halomonas elongata TaxID=2746 RepID=UPI0023AEC68A|nr:DUF3047 domain-containing protein [Halomonas elongata]
MIPSLSRMAVLLLTSGFTVTASGNPHFSADEIMTWSSRSFSGETDYQLIEQNGYKVLQAQSRGNASALYLEQEINLTNTPYIQWCWKVSNVYPGLDETTKQGDDYPARVYVARKTGLLPWQIESVNYVWASSQPIGADWINAFTDRAHLLALQSGGSKVGEWVAEAHDVSADYAKLFGKKVDHIDGVALMSDGDNASVNATAWFTHIAFSSSASLPECPSS